MSEHDRDLAEAIYSRLTSGHAIDTALELWGDLAELEPRERMLHLIAILAGDTIGDLLIEREREAARAGPWGEERPVGAAAVDPTNGGTP